MFHVAEEQDSQAHALVSCIFNNYITKYKNKQVNILISKNQALQILYLKHCIYKTT